MIYKSDLLSQFPELIHGSSSRHYGALRFDDDNSGANSEEVVQNRSRLAEAGGFNLGQAVLCHQVHGREVAVIGPEQTGDAIGPTKVNGIEADAMITNKPGPILIVQTADCIPLLLYASQKRAVAVVHAGWRGLTKNIVQEVVSRMKNEYNIGSSELFAAAGPSICGQCYDVSTVDDDRIAQFKALFLANSGVIRQSANKVSLDLPLAAKQLMLNQGIPDNQIELNKICTFEQCADWPSYRKDPDSLATPIWTFIGLKHEQDARI